MEDTKFVCDGKWALIDREGNYLFPMEECLWFS